MKLTFNEFVKYLDELNDYARKGIKGYGERYAKDVYLTKYNGCVPAGCDGEDVMLEIIRKFKLPIQFVIKVIESEGLLEKGQRLDAMVEPSFEDSTHSIVYLSDMTVMPPIVKIVYDDWTKAWHYSFKDKAEFESHLEAVREIIVMKR
jgi:hypothetical protein